MSQLNSLLESANPYKSLQGDAARLANKWSKTGLLEGLGSESDKNNMSMILENQAKQLVTEESNTGGGAAAGNFTPGTGAQWAGVALPLVRKVFGQIAAKEFVSVQPMNLPSGLVFFLDFQYGSTTDPNNLPYAKGSSLYGDSITGLVPDFYENTGFGNTNTGGLYGAGRFSYSINRASNSIAEASLTTSSFSQNNESGAPLPASYWYSLLDADSDFKETGSYSICWVQTSSLDTQKWDSTAVKSFYLSGSVNTMPTIAQQFPQFTRVTESVETGYNACFAIVVSENTVDPSKSDGWIFYNLQPTDADRGDFEEGNTNLNTRNNPITIPEINVQMKSEAIVAKTRKLKAVWTPEFAQDLNAYHSLDAEAELTSIMSEYISLEIDLEILDMLIESAAAGNEYWTALNNNAIDSTGLVSNSLGFYNSQGQWFQTLGTKMQKLSNIIHQKTLRGGANFLVCSPTVATIIESIPGFASNSDGDVSKASYAFGVQKAGAINNRYTVYKNPYMTENTILMGYRGGQFLEAGAVFAPYIPLIMTPLVYEPDTFTPRKGLLTRYAKKVVRPEFYGKIFVGGTNTL